MAETIEPRVMQVLVTLARQRGKVVSRDELVERCWEGRAVSEDAINRSIAKVRRLGEACGEFVLETIPRVGYRLTEATGATAEITARDDKVWTRFHPVTRRRLLGAALLASVAGFTIWAGLRDGANPRVAELMQLGRQALREELPDSDAQGAGFFREAVSIEPDNAEAWGLLALALRNAVENAPPRDTTETVRACELAARRALSLDPLEGNALAALAGLQPFFGDWLAAEDRLRGVLAIAPGNVAAIGELVTLLQSVGRCRDSWVWNERAAALDPLSPVPQYRRALKHWIFGRVSEADLAIDRALQLWPRHPGVWNSRLQIFAFTGRAPAALALIADEPARPPTFSRQAYDLWRTSLVALDSGDPKDVSAARKANVEAAPRSPGFANNAVMVLSLLGEIDAAFAVTDGYLLRRGALVGRLWTGNGQMPVNDQRWRRTMMLFTPATAALRADPRFGELCAGIGLADYWRRRAIQPDFPIAAV
ncbi:MAG TPA: winged helix-turn-helix domain-containing protein [Allosphingosinicella sp.]